MLPDYEQQLSLCTLPSQSAAFIKAAFEQPHPTTRFHELMLRQFPQTCQAAFLALITQPKLTRARSFTTISSSPQG
jgi:hypothetical protein